MNEADENEDVSEDFTIFGWKTNTDESEILAIFAFVAIITIIRIFYQGTKL